MEQHSFRRKFGRSGISALVGPKEPAKSSTPFGLFDCGLRCWLLHMASRPCSLRKEDRPWAIIQKARPRKRRTLIGYRSNLHLKHDNPIQEWQIPMGQVNGGIVLERRLQVMITVKDMPASLTWFKVWRDGAGLLQCEMEK
jgi:hypothetical protein